MTSGWSQFIYMEGLFALALFSIALLCVLQWRKPCNRVSYPPGPRALPLLGNYLQIPCGKSFTDNMDIHLTVLWLVSPWVTYTEWRKVYGRYFIKWIISGLSCLVFRGCCFCDRFWQPLRYLEFWQGSLRALRKAGHDILWSSVQCDASRSVRSGTINVNS